MLKSEPVRSLYTASDEKITCQHIMLLQVGGQVWLLICICDGCYYYYTQVKWYHNNLWSLCCGATVHTFISGEDFSHSFTKIESVGLQKCPYYYYLTKYGKWYHNNKHFAELAPHHGRHRYGKKLCHGHPIHIPYTWVITWHCLC